MTTHGTLKLEDFKGGWLVLFSHPADFTPVCTTEFVAFAKIHSKLRELIGADLVGTEGGKYEITERGRQKL